MRDTPAGDRVSQARAAAWNDPVNASAYRDRELEERNAENEALRHLARQMAAVPDSSALLRLLCEAAQQQCGAGGASVLRVSGDKGVVVGAVGVLRGINGQRLPLRGTFTERLMAIHALRPELVPDPITTDAYRSESHAFNMVADDVGIGPMVVTPLVSHAQVLGVLSIARLSGSEPFSERDIRRVRVIADHASLVLWKSDLLEQAQAANEAKAKFLASVSHELRTPLAALTGYGELLADGVLGALSEEQRDAVERMRNVTHQLTLMIDEVLTFTALDAGRELIEPRPACPGEILCAATTVLEPLAERKGLPLHRHLPERWPEIVTDPDKVRQILVNLGGNAIKFTDRGEVVMSLEDRGHEILFAVRDTGIGIPADAIGSLFRPFTQLDAALTRRHGGTGLGLYISRRLAHSLGGHIEVESEVGRGSVFTLFLPRA